MIIDSQFFRDQAAEFRALEAEAIKWTIRQALANMATRFERIAAELEAKERLPAGAALPKSSET